MGAVRRRMTFGSNVESEQERYFIRGLTQHKVTRNIDLLNDLRTAFALTPLSSYPDKPYTETELPNTSWHYLRASKAFTSSNRLSITISKITRVDNTFHVLQYHLMKDKYRQRFDEPSLSQHFMFYGTKMEYLNSICTYNFCRSKVNPNGIYFAKKSSFYASHYHPNNRANPHKVMVIAQMLFGRIGHITEGLMVHRGPYYTTTTFSSVYEKYDDASFYPLYIVYYDGRRPKNKHNSRALSKDLQYHDGRRPKNKHNSRALTDDLEYHDGRRPKNKYNSRALSDDLEYHDRRRPKNKYNSRALSDDLEYHDGRRPKNKYNSHALLLSDMD